MIASCVTLESEGPLSVEIMAKPVNCRHSFVVPKQLERPSSQVDLPPYVLTGEGGNEDKIQAISLCPTSICRSWEATAQLKR